MEARELMVDNFIIVNHKTDRIAIVDAICRGNIECRFIDGMAEDMTTGMIASPDKIIGIPISEEGLLRLGMEITEDLGDMKYFQLPNQKQGYGICLDHDDIQFYKYNGDSIEVLIHDEPYMQHVHHFQNAVFSLTGTELTIKEE